MIAVEDSPTNVINPIERRAGCVANINDEILTVNTKAEKKNMPLQ
jgi:hypothetical protein